MSNLGNNKKMQESEISQYGAGGRSTPQSSNNRPYNSGINNGIKLNDDDLLASQIEPPTFIIQFNDPDQTCSDTNEFIQEIERNAEPIQHHQPMNRQPYGYAYPSYYPSRYEDEMKYYQHNYPMMHEGMGMRHDAQMDAMMKDPEYMHHMMSQNNYMAYENMQMPRAPQVAKPNQSLDNQTTPESFLDGISPEWKEIQLSKREKLLKDFMIKFLAFQVVEASKASQVDQAFWDWCFSLFPCNSNSSSRFKHYSDIWI